jgi:DNA-binding transcriptional regulator YiaG
VLREPLSPNDARRLVRQALDAGAVAFSKHGREEMAKDGIDEQDVAGVLRGGVVEPAELEHGTLALPDAGGRGLRRRGILFRDGHRRGDRVEEVMQCTQCGGPMQTAREDRPHADLSAIMLRGIEVRRCTTCDDEQTVIPRLAELHRAIAAALLTKRARLAPAEIRFLRKAAEWTPVELGSALDVAPESPPQWEAGTEQPNGPVDRLIRTLVAARLGLPLSLDVLSRIGDTNEPLATALRFGPAGWAAVDEADPVSVWRTSPREARRAVLDALDPGRFAGASDAPRLAVAVRAMLEAMTPKEA